ncbi:MAG: TniB family NTP-binding protein [Lachnospiraceae bacterium]|nr:TniB family NTP-binding protein [Lachnospiraceae bacterium]
MTNLSDIIRILPPMKSGDDLISALEVLPEYDEDIRNGDVSVRLMALSDLYRIYVPSQMSLEIYSKMYLALLRSLQKKGTKLAIQQKNQNHKAIIQQEYSGIMGGSDSFTIIGASGIGKSSAISRAISLITENKVIEVSNPYTKIIPCICVQCPFDSSVKGLLLEILRKVDEVIEGKYYQNALRARTTTDMLIGSVSQVALNHIGLLVVDEIQNVCNSKNGKSLVGMLTQLINNSGISICMVGTPESAVFFEQAMQLARRSLGLRYDVMEYGENFRIFCETVFSYQYMEQKTEITESIMEWLYEHTSGNISLVVSLIHDAQEIAILNGKEVLNLESLNEAYQKRLSLLHRFIHPEQKKQTSKTKRKVSAIDVKTSTEGKGSGEISSKEFTIADLVATAKDESRDIVQILKIHMPIVEVAV